MQSLIKWLAALLLVGLAATAQAADNKTVLQLSDGSPEKQTLVLNVANNLLKEYPNDIDVEVVAFGPGLRLLFADNANKERVQSLSASGVRFSACENTSKAMAKLLGHPPVLTKEAVPVSAGVGRIVSLTKQGYVLIRP